MATIEFRSVCKSFGDTEVIRDINLFIDDNEFVVFVGPSGCGKSTLLRLFSGLEDLTSGEMYIDGARMDHLAPAKRGLAMVFQSYALYPHMSVFQNMSYALRVAKESKSEIERKVKKAADILQLTELLERKPKALSGGQRQRVAIGRAIVRDPKVFLFDEPLSNLDAKLRVQMRLELTNLHRSLNATMIYVTHDQVEAMTMADKIVVLRDGAIEQVGAPLDLYHRPDNIFVAGFIGSPAMNFFEGNITNIGKNSVEADFGEGASLVYPVKSTFEGAVGDKVNLGVRPEHFGVDGEGEGNFKGELYAVERLGGETYLYIKTAKEQEVVVHAVGDRDVRLGQEIIVSFTKDKCHLFGGSGLVIR